MGIHSLRATVLLCGMAALPACRSETGIEPAPPPVVLEPAAVVPFVKRMPPDFPASALRFERALPPSFQSVQLYEYDQSPYLVVTWTSGASAFQRLANHPGTARLAYLHDANVTAGSEVDLIVTYDLVLEDLRERRMVICSPNGCTWPLRLRGTSPDGTVLWNFTASFPSPGWLDYEQDGVVRRVVLNPVLWGIR